MGLERMEPGYARQRFAVGDRVKPRCGGRIRRRVVGFSKDGREVWVKRKSGEKFLYHPDFWKVVHGR